MGVEQQNDPGPTEHDAAIMIRIQGGDREALAALYDLHAARLLAIGVKMVGEREVAEDILHDVFIEVWQRAGHYRADRASVRTWLVMRMRSRCLDRLRSARHRYTSRGEASWQQAKLQPGTSENPLRTIDAKRARHALEALPESQRQVLELGYFKGLSSSEIARHLDIPIGTVKSRTRAALSRLREGMGETS